MPEKRIARLGSKPMMIGATTVAPNMASTCWKPIAIVCPQGSRSSTLTIPDRVSFQDRTIVLLLAFPPPRPVYVHQAQHIARKADVLLMGLYFRVEVMSRKASRQAEQRVILSPKAKNLGAPGLPRSTTEMLPSSP